MSCSDYYDYHTIAQCRSLLAEQVSSICNSFQAPAPTEDFFTAADWLNLLSPGNLVRPLLHDEDPGANVGSLWIVYALGLACLIIFIWLVFWIPRRLFNVPCRSKKTPPEDPEEVLPPSKRRVIVAWTLIGLSLATAVGTIIAAQIYTIRIKNDVPQTSCAMAQSMYDFIYQPKTLADESDFHGIAKLMQLLEASANVSKIYTRFASDPSKGSLGQFLSVASMGILAPAYWTDYLLSKQKYLGWHSREGLDRPFGLELSVDLAGVMRKDLTGCGDEIACVNTISEMIVDSETGPLDKRVTDFAKSVSVAVEEAENSAGSFLSKFAKVQNKHFDINDEVTDGPLAKTSWILPTIIQSLTMVLILISIWYVFRWSKEDQRVAKQKGLRWFCYVSGWGCLIYFLLGSIGVCVTLFFAQSCDIVHEDILTEGDLEPFLDLSSSPISSGDIDTCLLADGSGDLLEAHGYVSEDYGSGLFAEPFDATAWPLEEVIKDKLNLLVTWNFYDATRQTPTDISAVDVGRSEVTDSRIAQAGIDDESIKTINRVLNGMVSESGKSLCMFNDPETCSSLSPVLVNVDTVYNFDPLNVPMGLDFGYMMAKSDDLREVFESVQSSQSDEEVFKFANGIYVAALRSAAIRGSLIRDYDPSQEYNMWENRLLFDPCPPLEPCSPWFIFDDDMTDSMIGFGGLRLGSHEEWKSQMARYLSTLDKSTVDDLVNVAIATLITTNPFRTLRSVIDRIRTQFSCKVVRYSLQDFTFTTCTRVGHHIGVLCQLWILLAIAHGIAYTLSFIWYERGAQDHTYLPKPDFSDDEESSDSDLIQFGFDQPPPSFRMQVMEKPSSSEADDIDRGLLIDAAMRGNLSVLEAHENVLSSTFDTNLNSLLHLAAFYGHDDCVIFLRGKCDLNHTNKLGYTAEGAVSVNQSMSPGKRDQIIRLLQPEVA